MKKATMAGLFVALACGRACAHTDLTPVEVKAWLDTTSTGVVLDVREESEFCDSAYSPPGHIPGAVNMPWNSGVFAARYGELPRDEDIIVVCRSGNRSNSAANFLDGQGFSRVYDMTGGMNQWLWLTELCASAGAPQPGNAPGGTLHLADAAPNPFGRETEIRFAIPPAGGPVEISLGVYDSRGRLVRQVFRGVSAPGEARVVWDGRDDAGRAVAGGVYFLSLSSSSAASLMKVVVLR